MNVSRLVVALWACLVGVACSTAVPLTAGPDSGALDAGAADGGATEADLLLGAERDALFERLVGAISSVQVVSDAGLARVGLTWEEALVRPRERFRSARTRQPTRSTRMRQTHTRLSEQS